MPLPLWHSHCESSPYSLDECRRCARRSPTLKPTDLSCKSACRLLLSASTIAIYYYCSVQKPILAILLCSAESKSKSRKEKVSSSDGGFVRRRCTARIIMSSDESGSDEPTQDNLAESCEISDSELAGIDLDFITENATF